MTLRAGVQSSIQQPQPFFLPYPNYDSPYRDAPVSTPAPSSNPRRPRVTHESVAIAPHRERPTRSRRKRRKHGSTSVPTSLTSVPTSRTAYVETRSWLLAEHGPVCAYCGVRFTDKVMTLDHVAPRRGQTAYDRRDNLVLACPGCNAAKRDQAPLAFLLGSRSRAAHLLSYGAHLSPMLVAMARSLVREVPVEITTDDNDDDESPYRD